MARYSAMAADSAARACSRWPVVAYRVPRPRWQWACERAHAELLGQGEGLTVVRFSGRDVRRVAVHGDLTEEPQGPRFLAPTFAVAGVLEATLGQPVSLLHTPGEEIRLPADDGVSPKLP